MIVLFLDYVGYNDNSSSGGSSSQYSMVDLYRKLQNHTKEEWRGKSTGCNIGI